MTTSTFLILTRKHVLMDPLHIISSDKGLCISTCITRLTTTSEVLSMKEELQQAVINKKYNLTSGVCMEVNCNRILSMSYANILY